MDMKLFRWLMICCLCQWLSTAIVQSSHASNFECYHLSTRGSDYTGHTNITRTGKRCYFWSQLAILPYGVKPYQHNFCRNDNLRLGGPWCFINEHIWDYCGIPSCSFIGGKLNRHPILFPKPSLVNSKPEILIKTETLIVTQTVGLTSTQTLTTTSIISTTVPQFDTITIYSTVIQYTPGPFATVTNIPMSIVPSAIPAVTLRTTITSSVATTLTTTATAIQNVTQTEYFTIEPMTTVTEYRTVTLFHNEYGPGFGEESQIDY